MKELIAHENSESLSQLFQYDCRHNFALEVGNAAFSFLDLLSNIYRADIVLIDGGPRNTLMALVAKYCKPGTFIIIDNSDATHNHLGLEHFGSQSFLGILFKGHGPMNSWEWETSIYWKLDSASIPSIGKSWGALFK